MIKKYKLTDQTIEHDGRTLYRIQALIDIPYYNVSKGDLGGYVESEDNLSQEGGAWVADNAKVYDNARVFDEAYVCHNACVYDNAQIRNHVFICDNACIYDDAILSHHVIVEGQAKIYGNVHISGFVHVYDDAEIFGRTYIHASESIGKTARVARRDDCFYATNVGPKSSPLTVYKGETDYKGEAELIVVLHDIYTGAIDGFLARSKARYDQKTYREHTLLVEVAKSRILGD